MEKEEFKIAVKSFIVNDGKLLIIKRADDDSFMPGIWEIPGGKLELNEDLILGLKRETKEETGLDIEVDREISVRDFTINDELKIELHPFLCNAIDIDNIKLSEEHSEYLWIDLKDSKKKLTEFFHPEIDILLNLENKKWP